MGGEAVVSAALEARGVVRAVAEAQRRRTERSTSGVPGDQGAPSCRPVAAATPGVDEKMRTENSRSHTYGSISTPRGRPPLLFKQPAFIITSRSALCAGVPHFPICSAFRPFASFCSLLGCIYK